MSRRDIDATSKCHLSCPSVITAHLIQTCIALYCHDVHCVSCRLGQLHNSVFMTKLHIWTVPTLQACLLSVLKQMDCISGMMRNHTICKCYNFSEYVLFTVRTTELWSCCILDDSIVWATLEVFFLTDSLNDWSGNTKPLLYAETEQLH